MNWSTPADLKAQVLRMWGRGELLQDAIAPSARFPLRLKFKRPTSTDITDRFNEVRTWANALAAEPHVRLEWEQVRHRVQGVQRLPASVWVDTLADALAWLEKQAETSEFLALHGSIGGTHPPLLPWLEKHPFEALRLAPQWPGYLAVIDWLLKHPRPGIYVRQVDLPGVHSKFIEANRAVLSELLDLCLPENARDESFSGVTQFAGRYGFRNKPARVRFRILDSGISGLAGTSCSDITLDADSFGAWTAGVSRVFITENEVNFLSFPHVPGSIVIFGSGYGWGALAKARWLDRCPIHYWGDIDTHGFAILNQLRTYFPHVVSFLMDRATLLAHSAYWGIEDKPVHASLPLLSADERALYYDLRDNRIRPNLRLEQELISFQWLSSQI